MSIQIKDVSEQVLADYDAVIESTYNYITEYDTSEIEEDYWEGETKVTRQLMLPRNRYGIEELSSSACMWDCSIKNGYMEFSNLEEGVEKYLTILVGNDW